MCLAAFEAVDLEIVKVLTLDRRGKIRGKMIIPTHLEVANRQIVDVLTIESWDVMLVERVQGSPDRAEIEVSSYLGSDLRTRRGNVQFDSIQADALDGACL